jgi:chemotaxis protein MotA
MYSAPAVDIATFVGIFGGMVAIAIAGFLEHVTLDMLLRPSAIAIIFGGTFGATMATVGMGELKKIPTWLRIAFFEQHQKPLREEIHDLVTFAEIARREGLLALEEHMREMEPGIVRRTLEMVVDGTDPAVVSRIMEYEISTMDERHKKGIAFFTAAGGFSPTMGIIGTVLGVIAVLAAAEGATMAKLAGGIATAFTATFFGIALANCILLPIAEKLKYRSEEERFRTELLFEGLVALQSGDNPRIVQMRLHSFLESKKRALEETEGEKRERK